MALLQGRTDCPAQSKYLWSFPGLWSLAVAVGLVPVTGQTLPLVSMGGSSIFFTSMATGMILSVSWGTKEDDTEKSSDQNENAVPEETQEKDMSRSPGNGSEGLKKRTTIEKGKAEKNIDRKQRGDHRSDEQKVEFEVNE